MRTSALALGLVASVAAGLSACGQAAGARSAAPDAAPPARIAEPVGADAYRAADLAFFSNFAYPEGDELEVYPTLPDALTGATAVVLARVTGVRVTRTLGGAQDPVAFSGITIRPVEVLRGSLPTEHRDSLTVEFIGVPPGFGDLQNNLPAGLSVWVLRNKGELRPGVTPKAPLPRNEDGYYRLVSSQGLFVQGESNVVNPLEHAQVPEIAAPGEHAAEPIPDPVVAAAEEFRFVSEFAAYARSM
jgi:hypothetical protein